MSYAEEEGPVVPETNQSNEEMRYPNRHIDLIRLPAISRNSGICDHKFLEKFRSSKYHFRTVVLNTQEKVLSPYRSHLVNHLLSIAPGYGFPECIVKKNEKIGMKSKQSKAIADEDEDKSVKFDYTVSSIPHPDDEENEIHDDNEKDGATKDSDSDKHESNDEDAMGDDYNAGKYGDLETGEIDESDEGDSSGEY